MTPADQVAALNPREREALKLMASGHPDKRVAVEMGITPHTVNSHLRAIYRAFGVHNRIQAAVIAAKAGLV